VGEFKKGELYHKPKTVVQNTWVCRYWPYFRAKQYPLLVAFFSLRCRFCLFSHNRTWDQKIWDGVRPGTGYTCFLNNIWLFCRFRTLRHREYQNFRILVTKTLFWASLTYSMYYTYQVHSIKYTDQINTNEMQLFSLFGVRTLHVSDALCVHHQEHYKL